MGKLLIVAEDNTKTEDMDQFDLEDSLFEDDDDDLSSLEELEDFSTTKQKIKEEPKALSPQVVFAKGVFRKIMLALKAFFSIPMEYVLSAIAIFTLGIFIFEQLKLNNLLYEKKLIGYIKVHHKIPKWHESKHIPAEAEEHLAHWRHEQEKIQKSFTVIKDDKNEGKPVMGSFDAPPLDNKAFMEILGKQDLGRVTESGVEKPELMNLSGYDLSKLNYKYWREFIGTDLRFTVFNDIEEEGLSFRGSSLTYAQFAGALIPKTNFIRSYLSYSNFYKAVLDGSSMIAIDARNPHFSGARMVKVNLKESKIMEADFSNTILDEANFKNAYARASNFKDSSMINVNFKNADLQGSSFRNADLSGSNFTNANLEGTDFTGANLQDVIFDGAEVTQAKFAQTRNVSLEQLNKVKFLLSARSIPQKIIPKKQSWQERFAAPHDPSSRRH